MNQLLSSIFSIYVYISKAVYIYPIGSVSLENPGQGNHLAKIGLPFDEALRKVEYESTVSAF